MKACQRLHTFLVTSATREYVQKKIDPALLTFSEYYKLVNKNGKWHPEDAYSTGLEKLQDSITEFPKLLKRFVVNNITFEVRLKTIDTFERKYCKTNPETNAIVTINGEIQYWTKEELLASDRKRYEYEVGVFDKGVCVGRSQNEWGCLLIRVADEYRGFGLGPIIGKFARELEPTKPSGGFTPSGYKNFLKVYQSFVREYLQNGFYSHLVKTKQITATRAKEIIDSAKLSKIAPAEQVNLNTDNPQDWKLYGDYGLFVIYDSKIKDIIFDTEYYNKEKDYHVNKTFWQNRAIKGVIYVDYYDITKKYRLVYLYGVNEKIKKFLVDLACSYVAEEPHPVRVPETAQKYFDPKFTTKKDYINVIKSPISDYRNLLIPEKMFRKQFDKYDEFRILLVEKAEQLGSEKGKLQ